jgi:hypothetical protein
VTLSLVIPLASSISSRESSKFLSPLIQKVKASDPVIIIGGVLVVLVLLLVVCQVYRRRRRESAVSQSDKQKLFKQNINKIFKVDEEF